MTGTRTYDMRSRDAAARTTRERIVDAACELFLARWYDDVTHHPDIADRAGVSGQTVINHFGGKERSSPRSSTISGEDILDRRYRPAPGDVGGAVCAS